MKSTTRQKPVYRPEIDGLRAFAVLSVVAFHAFPGWLTGGFVGVDIFFVISGFLITSQILSNYYNHKFRLAEFYGRRIRRILPALTIVLATSAAFGFFVLLPNEFAQLGKHVASASIFITNFVLADEIGYFDNSSVTKPLLHLWSLAVEEQFYILWPLVVGLSFQRKTQFKLLIITICLAIISFLLNLHLVEKHPDINFFLSFARFWELLAGSVWAWLVLNRSRTMSNSNAAEKFSRKIVCNGNQITLRPALSNLLSLIGFLLLAISVTFIDENLPFPSVWTMLPVSGALLIIISGSSAILNRVFLMNPIAVWLGLISYPFYLWHWPILSFLQIIYGEMPQISIRLWALAISILLAWLTYKFVEKPFREGTSNAFKSITLVMLLSIIGLVGINIYITGGVTRYNAMFTKISDAKTDWSFPNGLKTISGEGPIDIYATSQERAKILLIGDSHMEQYGPRIVDLYKRGLSAEVAFITSPGCPPIPNLIRRDKGGERCKQLLPKVNDFLNLNSVETIIIGAAFNSYFKVDNRIDGRALITANGNVQPISDEKTVSIVKDAFYKFVKDLSTKYRVVVLLDTPNDLRFDPREMLNQEEGRRPFPISAVSTVSSFSQDVSQVMLAREMSDALSKLSAYAINQNDLICPNRVCVPITSDGRPIYIDRGHMRPFFVIQNMDILDRFISN